MPRGARRNFLVPNRRPRLIGNLVENLNPTFVTLNNSISSPDYFSVTAGLERRAHDQLHRLHFGNIFAT